MNRQTLTGQISGRAKLINGPDHDQQAELSLDDIRAEAAAAERHKWVQVIKTELLWKNQDEGFIGGLQWVLDKLEGRDRL